MSMSTRVLPPGGYVSIAGLGQLIIKIHVLEKYTVYVLISYNRIYHQKDERRKRTRLRYKIMSTTNITHTHAAFQILHL